jgi:glycosyltransferase involved in cell wall biosynthesis
MPSLNTKKGPIDYLVILPIYNESLILKKSLTLLNDYFTRHWKNKSWKIVVVDNGSTDSPEKIVSDLANNIEFIKLDKKGRGYAIKEASKRIDSKIYICLDIDIPLGLDEIQKLIDPVQDKKALVSIGRRTGKRPIGRMFLTKALHYTNLLLLDLNIHDSQCGAIAYSKSAIKSINKCEQNGYFLHTELLKRVSSQGGSIVEIPINWVESRFKRKSKVNLASDSIYGFMAILEICKNFYPKIWKNFIALISTSLLMIATYIVAMDTFSKSGFYAAKYNAEYYPYLLFFAITIVFIYILFGSFLKITLKKLPKGLVISILLMTFTAIALIAIRTLPYRSQDIYHDLVLIKGNITYGLNPYLTTPNNLGAESWTKYLFTWKDLQMTYGPVWVYFLNVIVRISSSLIQILIMIKIIYLIVLVACGYLLNKIMDLLGVIKEKKIWVMGIFFLNPLVIQYFLIDLHNDIFICFSILLSYYFFLKKNYVASVFSLLGGGLIKYISLILIPIPLLRIVFGEKRNKAKTLLIIGIVSCVVLFAAYYPFGLRPELFRGIENEITQRAGVYDSTFGSLILYQLTKNVAIVKLVGIVIAIVSTFIFSKSDSPLRYVVPFVILFCIGAPWFMPHYIVWVIPLSFLLFPWWIIAMCTFVMYMLGPNLILPTPFATLLIFLIIITFAISKKITKGLFI